MVFSKLDPIVPVLSIFSSLFFGHASLTSSSNFNLGLPLPHLPTTQAFQDSYTRNRRPKIISMFIVLSRSNVMVSMIYCGLSTLLGFPFPIHRNRISETGVLLNVLRLKSMAPRRIYWEVR